MHNYERTEEQRKKYKEYTGKEPTGEYYFDLPKDLHRVKEGMGIHTNSSKLGMTWNAAWKKFFESTPDPDKSSILAQLENMIEITGIGKYIAVPK